MFYGEYSHSIDSKGRIIIPSKLRLAIKETYIDRFFLTRGLENCIFVFPEHEWHLIEQKFKTFSITQGKARAFSRMFFSGAYEVECDKQGRILVPKNLLQYASIENEAIVVGVLSRIEIWDSKKWQDCLKTTQEVFEEISEDLVEPVF
ncbi:division/cell wall cluster transcriptional repressor MraZ [Chlamydiota bacterium]